MSASSLENPPVRLIVAIGASAGGLQALETFFRAVPRHSGMAFIVIQHLSPDFKSLMDELLARFTDLPVHVVDGTVSISANRIYLLPPRKEMVLSGSVLLSRDKVAGHGSPELMVINTFFTSLAKEAGERGAAIILSGTGTDGSIGARAVREAGGLVLVQDPQDAKFSGMPRSAIATGAVQATVSPEEMPGILMHYIRDATLPGLVLRGDGANKELEIIFSRLSDVYGVDFKSYKPSTIARRIERRLALQGLSGLADYCRLVDEDDDELDLLYRDLLIGVTQFFRDEDAFVEFRKKVIPDILDQVPEHEDVRIWVCGCATGEEVYSLVMLFIAALEERKRPLNLKVFATDLHRGSLQIASEGRYPASALEFVPPTLRGSFFEPLPNGEYQVHPRLRRPIIFSPHNILSDPPFIRLDLVSCRNMLIYLKNEAQVRAISSFFFALKPRGYLFMGPSENPGELSRDLVEISRSWKIFQRQESPRLLSSVRQHLTVTRHTPLINIPSAQSPLLARLYDILLVRYIPDAILVNERREILHTFGQAGRYLSPPTGRMVNDITVMAHESLRLAISSGLLQALKNQNTVQQSNILFGERVLDLTAEPLFDRPTNTWFVLLMLDDREARDESVPTALETVERDALVQDRIQLLEAELHHLRESLQQTVEELETSNEELQASNEELLAANEELQSTNEELHAVNEELHAVNSEYENKIIQLDEVSNDLQNLIQATAIGTIFLDHLFQIRMFTPAARRVFNLLDQDIGRDLRHITSHVQDDHVFACIQKAIDTRKSCEDRVFLEDGTCFQRRVLPYMSPDTGTEGKPVGVVLTFVDITQQVQAEQTLRELNAELEIRVAARTRALEEANRQLAAQEMHTRRWLDLATDGVWDWDLTTDDEYLSPQFKSLFGYEDHELPNRADTWRQLIFPEDLRRAEQARIGHIERGEPYNLPVRYRHKDGSTVWVICRGMALQDEEGRYTRMLGTHTDITALKAAEEKIQALNEALAQRVTEREAHFQTLLERLPTLVWTLQPDGRCDYLSPQWLAYTGGDEASQLGSGWQDYLHPEDREGSVQSVHRSIQQPGVMEMSFRLLRHDGTYRWFRTRAIPLCDAAGAVVRWIGTSTDIHEQVRSMLALQESEQHQRRILDGALQPILTVDAAGQLIDVNGTTLEVFGYSREELLGKPLEILLPPEHRVAHIQRQRQFQDDAVARQMRPGRLVEAQRKDGSRLAVEVALVPLERGGQVEVVAFVRDLTELHALSAERDAITRKMTEAQRLESLGLLAGGVAHDFNNILTSIMANVSLMQLEDMSPAESRTAVDSIAVAGRRAAALCQQLLAYSGKGRFVVAPTDLNELVEDTVQLLGASTARQIAVRCVLAPGLPMPVVDAAQIQQVVMNLVLNAIEASPDGGEILVKTSVVVLTELPVRRWSSGTLHRGGYVVLLVKDSGSGITEENLSRIFEPFFTTKFSGRGLGLAAVQGIIRGHDGVIAVDTAPGQGTTFWVYLPTRSQPSPEEPAPAPAIEPQLGWRGQGKVLVIDDEEPVRSACRRMLERYGFTVLLARDGEEGLATFSAHAAELKLILLDLTMPGRDGLLILRDIHAQNPAVPVLLMSGHSPSSISLPSDINHVRFLPKPFTYSQFTNTIHGLLTDAGVSLKVRPPQG